MDGTTPRRSRPSISAIAAIALAGLQGICAIVILGLVGVRFGRASFSAAVSLLTSSQSPDDPVTPTHLTSALPGLQHRPLSPNPPHLPLLRLPGPPRHRQTHRDPRQLRVAGHTGDSVGRGGRHAGQPREPLALDGFARRYGVGAYPYGFIYCRDGCAGVLALEGEEGAEEDDGSGVKS